METGKLSLVIMAGAESKAWLTDLTKQLDRLEKITSSAGSMLKELNANEGSDDDEENEAPAPKKKAGKKKAPIAADDEEEESEESDDEESEESDDEESEDSDDDVEAGEDDAPTAKSTITKKNIKKAMKESDDEEEETDSDSEDDEDETPPSKTAKSGKKKAKLTQDDVDDACMDRCSRPGSSFKKTKALLMKHFKVESVSDLDPSQFEAVIKLMRGK